MALAFAGSMPKYRTSFSRDAQALGELQGLPHAHLLHIASICDRPHRGAH